jgi:hypothetical protein
VDVEERGAAEEGMHGELRPALDEARRRLAALAAEQARPSG